MITKKNVLCSWPALTRRWSSIVSIAAVCLANNNTACAADGTWANAASGGLWSDPANWIGGSIADGSGSAANFGTLNLAANNTVLLDAPHTLSSLIFGDTATTYYNWTLSNNGNAGNVLTLDGTSPSITVNTGKLTNNVVIAGSSGLRINGGTAASYLVLGTDNTFTGDVVVSNGTGGIFYLGLNTAGGLGGSASAPNSLVLAANSSLRAELMFYGGGLEYPSYNGLIMRPAAGSRAEVHSLKGNIIWNGPITLDGVSSTTSSLCDIYNEVTGSTLTLNGNISAINNFVGQLSLRHNTATSIGVVNGTINIPNANLAKNDPGTWTINSSGNSWSNTPVLAGTLKLGADNAMPIATKITMGGGAAVAVLDLNGHNQTVGALASSGGNVNKITNSTGSSVFTVNSTADSIYASPSILSGSLSLTKMGPANLTLAGANTYTGNTVISNGTLTVSGSINNSTNIIIGPGATLGGLTMTLNQKLLPADGTAIIGGTVNVGSGTLVLNYVKDTPALIVSNGNLSLSASGSVIINVTGSLVAGQSYLLVSTTGSGQVSGTTPTSVVLNGTDGLFGSLVVINSQLYLTMDTKPIVASQMPITYTNLVLFADASPSFSVSAGGLPPFGYNWYTNGVLIQGITNSSMTCTNVQLGSLDVYCVVTNASGSATSAVWSASVIAAPTAMYPSIVLSNKPSGYWRLNEPDNGLGNNNANVVAHDYLSGNNALYNNTILGQPGYSQKTDPDTTCALFGYVAAQNAVASGINGVDFVSPTNSTKAFTVEAWVSGYSPVSDSGIVAKGYGGGGEQFSLDTGGPNYGFRFFVRDANGGSHAAASSIVASYGVWNHLVGVCDEPNGVVKLYVNGQLAASGTISTNGGILASTSLMSIGARYTSATSMANNSYDNEFAGYINDVAVYNYALTASQVINHYSAAGIAPIIISQPVASSTINQNSTLTASAVVAGTQPLSYRWFDVNAGTYIEGQTNATLVITNFQVGNSYYLTVTNAYGSVDSSTISVGVVSGLNVSMVPSAGSLSLYSGTPLSFVVTASGTEPFYYRWFTNGVAVSGATSASYVLTVPSDTRSVSCLVSNSYNGLSSQTLGPVVVSGVVAPTNNYQMAVLSNSPVAYWPLSEADNGFDNGNAGVVAFDYVGGHNGTYANVNLGQSGYDFQNIPALTCAQFGVYATSNSLMTETDNSGNGVANISFAKPSGSNAQFSVEAWVNCANTSQTASLVSKGNGHSEQFALDFYNNGFRFVFRDSAGGAHDSGVYASLTAGTWYHVVGVLDGASGSSYLYVNGSRVRSLNGLSPGLGLWSPAVNANTSLPAASLVNIGSRTSSTTSANYDIQFQGKIANVALYNYALSTNQVAAHYYSATNLPPVIVTPGVLSINHITNGQVQLVWNFSGTLQSATNAAGPYNTEVGAVSPYTVSATNALMFYRVKQQ